LTACDDQPEIPVHPRRHGTVHAAVQDGVARVILKGEHDLATLPIVEAALRDATAGGGPTVVDLSECTFIDCAVTRAIRRSGDGMAVVVAADDTARVVRKVLDLVELPFTTGTPAW
jgi:hypothetical protein